MIADNVMFGHVFFRFLTFTTSAVKRYLEKWLKLNVIVFGRFEEHYIQLKTRGLTVRTFNNPY